MSIYIVQTIFNIGLVFPISSHKCGLIFVRGKGPQKKYLVSSIIEMGDCMVLCTQEQLRELSQEFQKESIVDDTYLAFTKYFSNMKIFGYCTSQYCDFI